MSNHVRSTLIGFFLRYGDRYARRDTESGRVHWVRFHKAELLTEEEVNLLLKSYPDFEKVRGRVTMAAAGNERPMTQGRKRKSYKNASVLPT